MNKIKYAAIAITLSLMSAAAMAGTSSSSHTPTKELSGPVGYDCSAPVHKMSDYFWYCT